MRVFNRLVVALLLAGLFVLGVYAIAYAVGISGYRLSELPFSSIGDGVGNFVRNMDAGTLPPLWIAGLILAAIIGLILLIAELKPPTPRYVRMRDKGTYATRGVVKEKVERYASGVPEVLEASARVKARRRSGAKVRLDARVRRGEDAGGIRSKVNEQVGGRLENGGIPVSKLKVKVLETDPRQTERRVR
jgi:hypothetical protein